MTDMTPTQARYLSYIYTYMQGFGLPPAESEIAAALDVSPPSANQMVKMLEKKGFIRRQPGVPRSIEILVAAEVIPKWKGKRISRTVWEWTLMKPPAAQPAPNSSAAIRGKPTGKVQAVVYRFKITLQDTHPEIWRRIETRDVTLEQLHALIQTAMGWTNSHMHQFEIAGQRYADSRFMMEDTHDDRGLRVSDLVAKHGAELQMNYEYDFGDGWEHEVVLEKMVDADSGISYPRCIEGARACPPEDVGGVYGFADLVAALANPSHPAHDDFMESYGKFDPSTFDALKATRRMKKGLPEW